MSNGLDGSQVFKNSYEQTRDFERAWHNNCRENAPLITYGGELAGALLLEGLLVGNAPKSYTMGAGVNFGRALGLGALGALGASEKPEDFVPNLTANLQTLSLAPIVASQMRIPNNMYIDELLSTLSNYMSQKVDKLNNKFPDLEKEGEKIIAK